MKISYITVTSSTIAVGDSNTVTTPISKENDSSLFAFSRFAGWCVVSAINIDNSTLSVTFLNTTAGAHTGTANIGLIEFK